jgi:hypothetical protein
MLTRCIHAGLNRSESSEMGGIDLLAVLRVTASEH